MTTTRLLIQLLLILIIARAFVFLPSRKHPTDSRLLLLEGRANNDNNQDSNGKASYKFGDISRSLFQAATSSSSNRKTSEGYKFGDLSKKFITTLTGKDEYQFGDLSRWADQNAKAMVANFTGKETYQVGDISKEIIRRAGSGEYTAEDLFFMLKVLLALGASLSPIARVLPIKVLLDLLNFSLQQQVATKVTEALSQSLDRRMKLALTGDAEYKLGDKTKQALTKSISQVTGKQSYQFGDITRTLTAMGYIHTRESSDSSDFNSVPLVIDKEEPETFSGNRTTTNTPKVSLDPNIQTELDEWDRALRERIVAESGPTNN